MATYSANYFFQPAHQIFIVLLAGCKGWRYELGIGQSIKTCNRKILRYFQSIFLCLLVYSQSHYIISTYKNLRKPVIPVQFVEYLINGVFVIQTIRYSLITDFQILFEKCLSKDSQSLFTFRFTLHTSDKEKIMIKPANFSLAGFCMP